MRGSFFGLNAADKYFDLKPLGQSSTFYAPLHNESRNQETHQVLNWLGAHNRYGRALSAALEARRTDLKKFVSAADEQLSRRLLAEYGALFVASLDVVVPPVCVFGGEDEVQEFQRRAGWARAEIAGALIELQPAAMKALLAARRDAAAEGLDITPRGGVEAGRRSFADTVRLWDSRYLPALVFWSSCGKLANAEADQLRTLATPQQIAAVLDLEERGLFFSKDFSKSVFHSVAPPGASQHLSMLAFDVTEFHDARVRDILARHSWFQTVQSDLPHFTYLGIEEHELPKRGLRRVASCGQIFWIPDLEA